MGRGIGIFSIAFLAFVIWVFASADPVERINRVCEPVSWMGNITESLFAVSFPEYRYLVTEAKGDLAYTCHYSIWRLFYEDPYLNSLRSAADAN